ncbi:MAG: hypothetical protein QXI60_06400 [Thermofilaceae archaeon]
MAKKGTTQGAKDAKKAVPHPPYKKGAPKGDGMLKNPLVQRQKISLPSN